MSIKSSSQLGLSGIDNTLLKTQGRRAVGGTITESSGYVIHTFTGSGQFTVLDQKLNVEYLIVAGGGGGGGSHGGGGGAGGVLRGNIQLTQTSYTITIGAGATQNGSNSVGSTGTNSSAFSLTALGGGGGGYESNDGNSGGSGGGAGGKALGGAAGTIGQGNTGGIGANYVGYGGGGGGGSAYPGGTGGTNGGSGGNGIISAINGTSTYYGGGGGGASYSGQAGSVVGAGGSGGGGTGGGYSSGALGTAGSPNTGGGGGGYGNVTYYAGAGGGSGIVIVKYLKDNTTIISPRLNTTGLILDLDGATRYSNSLEVEVLVVAGGGGGGTSGANYCGGGGAGGVLNRFVSTLLNNSYLVTVGSAGAAATNGGSSSFSSIAASGGGAGASAYATAGSSGGSGGGGGPINAIGGTGIAGQGFKGGNASSANQGGSDSGAGGGGGAGGPGYNLDSFPFTNGPGAGGPGIQSSISGTATWYAAGGAGTGYYYTDSVNGIGGGANGANGTASRLTGAANTGSGGGGGRSGTGNAGGSGVVIIRYKGSQMASGGTVTSSNGCTIHTFTGTGNFTVTGLTVADMSGYSNDAVLNNGAIIENTSANIFYFDGVNDYMALPARVGQLYNNDFTISFWWKSIGTQSNYATVIGQGFTGGPSNGAWAFKVQGSSSIVNFSYYYGGISDNATSTNPNDGSWHYIVATRTDRTLTLYMDNVSLSTITLSSYFVFGTSDTVYIGYNPRDNVYLKGYLGNIQVYNRMLSTTELLQNYNASRGRFGI